MRKRKKHFLFLTFLIFLIISFIICIACNYGIQIEKSNDDEKKAITVTPEWTFYSQDLQEWIDNHNDSDSAKIIIGVKDDTWKLDFGEQDSYIESSFTDETAVSYSESGRVLSSSEIESRYRNESIQLAYKSQRINEIQENNINTLLNNLDVSSVSKNSGDFTVNASYTYITCIMTKKEIKKLVNNKELISGVELYDVEESSSLEKSSSLNDVVKNIGLSTIAHPKGLKGDNIGIILYQQDGKTPYLSIDGINRNKYKEISSNGQDTRVIPLNLVCLQRSAPGAMIYGFSSFIPQSRLTLNPPAYIISYDFNINTSGKYNILSALIDNYVYSNKATAFANSGYSISNKNILNPGIACNAITVGAYIDSNLDNLSCYINPNTKCQKPEIVTESPQYINVPNHSYVTMGATQVQHIAAGMAACLMEAYPHLKNHPELIKAYLMAGAVKDIEPGRDKDGAGGINFFNSCYNGNYWAWNGTNSSYFINEKITRSVTLEKGKRYRIALTWLVPGSYVYQNTQINMDLDLRIKYNGTTKAQSLSYYNNHEFIDFTASNTGTHIIEIKRFANRDKNARVIMGLVLKKI